MSEEERRGRSVLSQWPSRSPETSWSECWGSSLDPDILERALTHRSYAYENGGLPTNERLEFLGDSVLGLVVTDTLYRNHPDLPEGQLAKLRAAVVNMRALAEVARELGLGRLPAARPGRGGHRRPRQVLDPGRHAGGADRRRLPRQGPGRGVPGRPPAVRPADRPLGLARAPGSTGRPRCRSSPPSEALGVPEYHVEESGPDHAKSFTRGRARRRRGATARVRAQQEGGRAAGGRGGLDARSAARDGARASRRADEATGGRRSKRRGGWSCLNCPRSRSSGAAWSSWVVRPRDRRRRGAAPAGGPAARAAGRASSPPGSRAARCCRAERRGKYLWLPLSAAAEEALLAHLGMSGQLLVVDPDCAAREAPAGPHRLRATAARTCASSTSAPSGTCCDAHASPGRRACRSRSSHIAPDPFEAAFDEAEFARRLRRQPHRGQAGAARPVADQRGRQHLRRRGVVARAAALGPPDARR